MDNRQSTRRHTWNPKELIWPPEQLMNACLQSFLPNLNKYLKNQRPNSSLPQTGGGGVLLINESADEIKGFCFSLLKNEMVNVRLSQGREVLFMPSPADAECCACYLKVKRRVRGGERMMNMVVFVHAPFEVMVGPLIAVKVGEEKLMYSRHRNTFDNQLIWKHVSEKGLVIYPPPHHLFTEGAKSLLFKMIEQGFCCYEEEVKDLQQQLQNAREDPQHHDLNQPQEACSIFTSRV